MNILKSVKIKLDASELDWCENHAKKIVEHYGGNGSNGSGTYNHNKVSSNMVGVKCEVATVKWLKNNGISKEDIAENFIHFTNKKLKGDIALYEEKDILEVKGLRPHQWNKFKRMIPPKQLNICVRNDAILIWGIATGDKKNREVKLMGWNHSYEVKEYGRYIRTICDNMWLEEDSLMRDMKDLIDLIND